MAGNGRMGWSLEENGGSVDGVLRGGVGNASVADGNWHVVVATWDGSEISNDNAGDDRNMKLFVDSIDQGKTRQGPYHFNVGREAIGLLLGDSQTNMVGGFDGDIAEVRLYCGELQLHEIDRILTALRARYVSGSLGVEFERPWTDRVAVPAGQSLRTRGLLTGGGTSMTWEVVSGPAPVAFSDVGSPSTEIVFGALGTHVLRAVEVIAPGASSSVAPDVVVGGKWLSGDVESVGVAGSYAETAGVHTLNGAGSGVEIGEGGDL